MTQDDHIHREAVALWRELFADEPPQADGSTLLALVMRRIPDTTYTRLRSPHLRPAVVHMPRCGAA